MKERRCIWCRSTGLRRVHRTGFLRRYIFPLLGFYPWECMSCRRMMLMRADGRDGTSSGV